MSTRITYLFMVEARVSPAHQNLAHPSPGIEDSPPSSFHYRSPKDPKDHPFQVLTLLRRFLKHFRVRPGQTNVPPDSLGPTTTNHRALSQCSRLSLYSKCICQYQHQQLHHSHVHRYLGALLKFALRVDAFCFHVGRPSHHSPRSFICHLLFVSFWFDCNPVRHTSCFHVDGPPSFFLQGINTNRTYR